jgi:dienelactone hydrolase
MSNRRSFGRALTMGAAAALVLLTACSSGGSQQGRRGVEVIQMPAGTAKYFPGESPFAVGAIPDAVLHDPQRNRDVAMAVEYPTRGGPYPVIVFSHAYGSSKDGYVALTEYWVGHGYICIKPSHADAGAIREAFMPRPEAGRERGRQGRNRNSGAEVRNEPPRPPPESQWAAQTSADWMNRARDISFIVESIGDLEQKYPELAGKIDRTRVGVGGDNYGAFTAMLVAGMTSFKATPPLHPANNRVLAALAMSPQGASEALGLTPESWRDVKVPAMFMTGTLDRGLGEDGDPKWRHDPFAYSPAGDKYFLSFTGASRRTFAGVLAPISDSEVYRGRPQTDVYGNPVNTPAPTSRGSSIIGASRRIFGSIEMASLAFWDAYLKNDSNAREYLNDPALLTLNGGGVVVERK